MSLRFNLLNELEKNVIIHWSRKKSSQQKWSRRIEIQIFVAISWIEMIYLVQCTLKHFEFIWFSKLSKLNEIVSLTLRQKRAFWTIK